MSKEEKFKLTQQFHKNAMDLAVAGNYIESLQFFRAAVRLSPENTLYLNDLGVTEMRTGDYVRAAKRFRRVLDLEQKSQSELAIIANDNLNELRDFMNPEDFRIGIQKYYSQTHTVLPFPEVSAEELFLAVPLNDLLEQHKREVTIEDSEIQVCGDMSDLPDEQLSLVTIKLAGASDICSSSSRPTRSRISSLLDQPFISRRAFSAVSMGNLDTPIDTPIISLQEVVRRFGGARVDFYPHGMSVRTSLALTFFRFS